MYYAPKMLYSIHDIKVCNVLSYLNIIHFNDARS